MAINVKVFVEIIIIKLLTHKMSSSLSQLTQMPALKHDDSLVEIDASDE